MSTEEINSAEFKRRTTIDINKQLAQDAATGKSEVAVKILQAIAANKPFMLYENTQRFTVVIPKMKAILTFFPGAQSTVELLDELQFQNRVKMQYVIYPNFETPTKAILKQAIKLIMAKTSPKLIGNTK